MIPLIFLVLFFDLDVRKENSAKINIHDHNDDNIPKHLYGVVV